MDSSASQQAYDRGHTIFSPDGRLYQVEYAEDIRSLDGGRTTIVRSRNRDPPSSALAVTGRVNGMIVAFGPAPAVVATDQ